MASSPLPQAVSPEWSFDDVVSPEIPFKNGSEKDYISKMTEADLLKGFGIDAKEEKHKPPAEPPKIHRNGAKPRRPPSPHPVPFVKEPNKPGVVEPSEREEPLEGRIHLLPAPIQRYFVALGFNQVEPWLWKRTFNILRNYAYKDKHGNKEWLRLDTFEEIYMEIFRERFRQPKWTEPDLLVVFSWFYEFVYLDVDAAGFAWTSLKETPIKEASWKVYDLREKAKVSRKKFREEEATAIPIGLQHPPREAREVEAYVVANNIFGILLEYFPCGMDCLQLRRVYEEKYWRDGPPLPYKDVLEFCGQDLADLCKFDQKSVVHGILYPRLDLRISPPNYFSLGHLEETQKEVQRKLEWRRHEANIGFE